jgi:hypothetical protein
VRRSSTDFGSANLRISAPCLRKSLTVAPVNWRSAQVTGVVHNHSGPGCDAPFCRLPSSKFPQLPSSVRQELNRRGCTIPQVWGAPRPGNVIQGSFIQAGDVDWAVLCSINRTTSILIFRRSSTNAVVEFAREADVDKLQGMGSDHIGYSRAIFPVGREFIMQHYHAYGGVKPPPIDHVGIDDGFVGKASVVRYFYRGKWLELTGAD